MIHHGSIPTAFSSHSHGKNRKYVTCVDICEDLVACGSNDGNVELLQIVNQQTRTTTSLLAHILIPMALTDIIFDLKPPKGDHKEASWYRSVTSIRISPCLSFLAFGTSSGEVFVFSIKEVESIYLIGNHSDHKGYPVKVLCWSPNSEMLISGCDAGRVIEWKPSKLKTEDRSSLSWALSLLGLRSGNLLYYGDSPIHQLETSLNPNQVLNLNTLDSYLLAISIGCQSILLVIQRSINSSQKRESIVSKTIKIEPGSKKLNSLSAAALVRSPTFNYEFNSIGYISLRKGSYMSPEIVVCDCDGQHYQSFNLKFLSDNAKHEKSMHYAWSHSQKTKIDTSFSFGFKFCVSSVMSTLGNILFAITDENRLCMLDIHSKSIQFFPLFQSSNIQAISVSGNYLVVLRIDQTLTPHIDLFENISPSMSNLPMAVFNSSVYRAIKLIQQLWRKRNTLSSDVWRDVLSPQGEGLSLSVNNGNDSQEKESDDSFSSPSNKPAFKLNRSFKHVAYESHKNDIVLLKRYDDLEEELNRALQLADSDIENLIFNDNGQISMFADLYADESRLSCGWNIDTVAQLGLPIMTDSQGRVRSLPQSVVDQLKSLHACVSTDLKNTDPIASARNKSLRHIIRSLDCGDNLSTRSIFPSEPTSGVGTPSNPYSEVLSKKDRALSFTSLTSLNSRSLFRSAPFSDTFDSHLQAFLSPARVQSSTSNDDLKAMLASATNLESVDMASKLSSLQEDSFTLTELLQFVDSTLSLSELALPSHFTTRLSPSFPASPNSKNVLSSPSRQFESKIPVELLLLQCDKLVESTHISLLASETENDMFTHISDLFDSSDLRRDELKNIDTFEQAVFQFKQALQIHSQTPAVKNQIPRSNQSSVESKSANIENFCPENRLFSDSESDSESSSAGSIEFMHDSASCWIESWWNHSRDNFQPLNQVNQRLNSARAKLSTISTDEFLCAGKDSDQSNYSRKYLNSHMSWASPSDISELADAFYFDGAQSPMTYEVNLFAPMGLGISLAISPEGILTIQSFKLLSNGDKGPAELCGVIDVGDQIIAINKQILEGVDVGVLTEILSSNGFSKQSVLVLTLRRVEEESFELNDNKDLEIVYSNPLLDVIPTIAMSVGDVMDSPEEVSETIIDDSHQYITANMSSLAQFVGAYQPSFISQRPTFSLKQATITDIQSNHLYPHAAITCCITDKSYLDDSQEPKESDSEELWFWQKKSYIAQYSAFFNDSKYPRLLRTDNRFADYIKEVTDNAPAYENFSVTLFNSSEVIKLLEAETQLHSQANFKMLNTSLISEYCQSHAVTESPKLNPDEQELALQRIQSLLERERYSFRNISLRTYHPSKQNQNPCESNLNPFDLNPSSVSIPRNSELGIYLPGYSVTIELLWYLQIWLSTMQNATSDEKRQSLLASLLKILYLWTELFVPLSIQHRQKLWKSEITDVSLFYAKSHGFDTCQDMLTYLRLVTDLVTLLFGLGSCGEELVRWTLEGNPNLLTFPRMTTKTSGWALSFPSAWIRHCNAEFKDASDRLWKENDMLMFISKYEAYLHADFAMHCCCTRGSSMGLRAVLTLASYDSSFQSILVIIGQTLSRERAGSLNLSAASARSLLKLVSDKVGNSNSIFNCALTQNLGALFHREDNFAIYLATSLFPCVTPWLIKYSLFGDAWKSQIIPLIKFEDLSQSTEDPLEEWFMKARDIYQRYLSIIARRYRGGYSKDLVDEWLELLLFLHRKSFGSEFHAIESNYSQNIDNILSQPELFTFDNLKSAEQCVQYGYLNGAIICLRNYYTDAVRGEIRARDTKILNLVLVYAAKALLLENNINKELYVKHLSTAWAHLWSALWLTAKESNSLDLDQYLASQFSQFAVCVWEEVAVICDDQVGALDDFAEVFARTIVIGLGKDLGLLILGLSPDVLISRLHLTFFQWATQL